MPTAFTEALKRNHEKQLRQQLVFNRLMISLGKEGKY